MWLRKLQLSANLYHSDLALHHAANDYEFVQH